MKNIFLALFLIGCSPGAANNVSASKSKSDTYVQTKAKWVVAKYYPQCVKLCYKHTYNDSCPDKCRKDFYKILELMVRSVKESQEKEDDFDAIMESWYGSDN